ncbi:ROK family protein [Luethyella okanaganae]|uniref:ROK family protein n=1 Tax=Luethyella okanaganae TaxID=69372 RepID=A0ABW1VJ21_9MICO
MNPTRYSIGIDIGGTKIAAAMVDGFGRASSVLTVPTPAKAGPRAILDAAAGLVERVVDVSGIVPAAFGLGSAGAFDLEGTVVSSTEHLSNWAGTEVAAELQRRLGSPVSVLNDVHAAALGELWTGQVPRSSMLFIAVGTGIGGAIVVDGRVMRGVSGLAGSIGHVTVRAARSRMCSCGVPDHVEAYASGPAIELTYRDLTHTRLTLPEIGSRALSGEPEALAVIREAAALLAESVATTVTLSDPGAIVLGGGVLGLGEVFAAPLASHLAAHLPPLYAATTLEAAMLGNNACLAGAAGVALRVLDGASMSDFVA